MRCHKEHSLSKFWGACNVAKSELDECFREEKRMRRRQNWERKVVRADKMLADLEARERGLAPAKKD